MTRWSPLRLLPLARWSCQRAERRRADIPVNVERSSNRGVDGGLPTITPSRRRPRVQGLISALLRCGGSADLRPWPSLRRPWSVDPDRAGCWARVFGKQLVHERSRQGQSHGLGFVAKRIGAFELILSAFGLQPSNLGQQGAQSPYGSRLIGSQVVHAATLASQGSRGSIEFRRSADAR